MQPGLRQQVNHLIAEFHNNFALSLKEFIPTDILSHFIELTDKNAIVKRPYRFPNAHEEILEKLITELLKADIIEPSHSPYSSPCLLVLAKGKSPQLILDFRDLNKVVIGDQTK